MATRLSFLAVILAAINTASPQDGQLSLGGVVTNSSTGEPLNHVLVRITRLNVPTGRTPGERLVLPHPFIATSFTDGSGGFRFAGLAPGNYAVLARKPQFVLGTEAGAQASNTVNLTSSTDNVKIKLSPLGVITGRVVDQEGEPLRGVNILALTVQIVDGLRQTKADRNVSTDDRGMYRLWNLQPGKYYIKAAGKSGGTYLFAGDNTPQAFAYESFAPVYFGGAKTMDSATPIEIAVGAGAKADVALKMEPAFKIRGALMNFAPRRTVKFELLSGDEDVSASRVFSNGDTGSFEVQDVVPGSYILRATQGNASGELAIQAGSADVNGVTIALNPPVQVKGTTHIVNPLPDSDSMPGRRFAGGCNTTLRGRNGKLYNSPPSEEFTIADVMPGSYRVLIHCFDGYATSARSGNQDLLANPVLNIGPGSSPPLVEILVSRGGGMIQGTVRIDSPERAESVSVLLVPQFTAATDPAMVTAFRPPNETSGDFQFYAAGLAPGTYSCYAFLKGGDIEYRNPQFLQRLTGGVSVQVEDNTQKTLTITGAMP